MLTNVCDNRINYARHITGESSIRDEINDKHEKYVFLTEKNK